MKTNKEIKLQLSKLNEVEKTTLNDISDILKEVSKDGNVNMNNFQRLTNALTELNVFRENMISRILRLLKQNHMVD